MKLEVVQHQGARERWPKGAAPAGAPVAAGGGSCPAAQGKEGGAGFLFGGRLAHGRRVGDSARGWLETDS